MKAFHKLTKNNKILCIICLVSVLILIWSLYSNNLVEKFEIAPKKNEENKIEVMNYLLKKVVDILDKNNIPYYLDCGTLLGVIRENNLMEKDTDIDITIHLSMWDKLKAIDFKKNGLIKTRTREGYPPGYIISVRPTFSDFYCDIYANPAFPLLKKKNLNANLYSIPVEPELYLTQLYGNWRVPSKKHADWPDLFYKNDRLIQSDYSKNWDLNYKIIVF